MLNACCKDTSLLRNNKVFAAIFIAKIESCKEL